MKAAATRSVPPAASARPTATNLAGRRPGGRVNGQRSRRSRACGSAADARGRKIVTARRCQVCLASSSNGSSTSKEVAELFERSAAASASADSTSLHSAQLLIQATVRRLTSSEECSRPSSCWDRSRARSPPLRRSSYMKVLAAAAVAHGARETNSKRMPRSVNDCNTPAVIQSDGPGTSRRSALDSCCNTSAGTRSNLGNKQKHANDVHPVCRHRQAEPRADRLPDVHALAELPERSTP